MFKASIKTNHITVTNPNNETITSGSVNVNFIQFLFSEDWRGLRKTVLFQTKKTSIPVILEGDDLLYTMPIPWETLVYANESINVGAYGTRMDDKDTLEDEEVVLPTVWGTIPERIRQGVVIADPTPTSPTYDAYQLLLKTIEDLIANEGSGGGNGTPGVSPIVNLIQTENGVILTVKDVNGEQSVTITNGINGTDGQNGVSPIVSIETIEGGHRLTITDSEGSHAFDVMNGTEGPSGKNGISPTVSITEIDGGNQVTITDADGPHAFDVMDGEKGDLGGDSNIYSAEETRIGTYMDKPLYRKCITGYNIPDVATSNPTSTTIPLTDLNIDTVVKIYAKAKRDINEIELILPSAIYVYGRQEFNFYSLYVSPTLITIQHASNGTHGTNWNGAHLTIWIEYTKTAD